MAKEESLQESTDLLFAWLSPIESKRDRRMHASTNVPASSPLVNKARSAIRKTVRASHVNSLKKSAKSKGTGGIVVHIILFLGQCLLINSSKQLPRLLWLANFPSLLIQLKKQRMLACG